MELSNQCIFTTGAYIKPYQDTEGIWHWQVVKFEDDTFCNGRRIEVVEAASTQENLETKDTEENKMDLEDAWGSDPEIFIEQD